MPHFPKPFFKKGRRLWYVQIDGRQINLGPERDEAFRQYHHLMAVPKRSVEHTGDSHSLAAIRDHFLEWVQQNRAPDTYEWYRYRLQRFVESYPDLSTAALRPYHVEEWVDRYELSITARRNYLRSVKRCMKWASRMAYIASNPIADLEIPSAERKECCVSPQEFQALLAYVRDEKFKDLLTITYETGCRPQESLRVEARHVDLAHHRWVFPQSQSKMKQLSRIVYLTDSAIAITKRWMAAYPDGALFRNTRGCAWSTEAVNCVFDRLRIRMGKEVMHNCGETIAEQAIRQLMPSLKTTTKRRGIVRNKTQAELREEAKRKLTNRRAAQLAPRYSLYALRHSWATNALQRGVDALTVAILMGHKDPSTLARVYQHLSHNPEHLLAQAIRAAG